MRCPVCRKKHKFSEELAFTKFVCSCKTELYWHDQFDKDENQTFYLTIAANMIDINMVFKVEKPSLGGVLY